MTNETVLEMNVAFKLKEDKLELPQIVVCDKLDDACMIAAFNQLQLETTLALAKILAEKPIDKNLVIFMKVELQDEG